MGREQCITSGTMKIELCAFSGYKIDGRKFTFINAKSEALHLTKRNPRKVSWTVLYRRKHRKCLQEETSKRRTRRATKFQRAITGASLNDILAKRNQKPEVRQAQREQAIRAAKDKQKAKDAVKKPVKAAQQKPIKQKAQKHMGGAKPRVGGKR